MRIKKLEIQGFKSFADRVSLTFGPGITGVVGPNGCGKSNVVDALRWVMGEQSAKHLRGSSMQDVIFDGSEARGPVGMAEVTVTFENDGQGVPPEYAHYSEISVTRRLYRDGESDYLINKTPCRLKDITELFLGTGIGTKAYSIIEQGQVSTLIKAKPEDRRRIIEEAAGITKYKARRQAAERKMEATRQNLLRITDVTSEVARRLGSLKRQARKAERYKELKALIRSIELQQAALAFLELTTCLAYDREVARDEEEALTLKEGRVAELDARIETERLRLTGDDERLEKAQGRLYELDHAIALAEQQKEHARSTIEQGQRREQEAMGEIEGLKEALALIQSQRAELEKGAEELYAEAEADERALEEARQRVDELNARRIEHTRSTESLRTQVMQAVTRSAQAKSDIGNLEARAADVARRREEAILEIEEAKAQIAATEEKAAGLEEERAKAEAERVEKESEKARLLRELDETKGRLSEVKERVLEKREVLGEQKSRLSSLMDISARYERAPEGVRALMQRAETSGREGTRGIRGLFADLFEAPAEAEVAIESVLGDSLQAVVVEDAEAAREALRYLKDSDQGRAKVLVADALPAPSEAAIPDGLTALLSLVKVPEWHAPVVQAVLGRVVLAETFDDALARWPELRARGLSAVTKAGEVLLPDGSLRGGSVKDADSGLLRHKREIRELSKEVEQLEAELAELVEAKEQLSRRVGELGTGLDTLSEEIHRLTLLALERKQEVSRARDEASRLSQRRDERSAEAARLAEQAQAIKDELANKREVLRLAEEEKARYDDDLRAQSAALGSLDAEIHRASDELTQLKVKVAAKAERRENLKRSLEHQQQNERDVRARIERLELQIREAREERERLSRVIEESETKVRTLLGERAHLKDTLEKDRAAFEEAAQRVRELEGELRTTRTELDAARKRVNELTMRIRERELALDALEQRTQSAHSVSPKDVIHDYHLLPLPDKEQQKRLVEVRRIIDNMGEINLTAIEEAKELEERHNFLKTQADDLTHALEQLEKAIIKINRTTKKRFLEAFEAINERFQQVFPRLFRGGKAWLALTDPNDLLNTGVEIYAQPPGKKLGSVSLMSGGEQALTAVSLIFSIFLIKPSPFCLLDEVDAPLDEANVGRFNEMIKDVSSISQFIVITHNKRTMEAADQLYGVTMEEPGISKMVNVRMH